MIIALSALSEPLQDEQTYKLPVIIITPDWHDIDLQRASSTVNMLSGEQLDTAGINNTRNLQYKVPGFLFKSSSGVGESFLRGIGGTSTGSGDSGVSSFMDGIYLTSAVQSFQDFYDIDRVEIIKGPHGVHLGRNVLGGAVSIITHDPVPYYEAYGDVLYGTSNQQQFRGALNLPVFDSGMSFRLAGTMLGRDGYSRNIFRHEDLDDQDYYAWRGKLRYTASTDLDIIFSMEQTKQNDTSGLAKQPDPDVGVNGGILLGGVVPDDPRKVTHNVDQNQAIKTEIYSARVTLDTDSFKIKSTSAYWETDLDLAYELDGTNIDFSSNFPASNSTSFSQEFRFESFQNQPLTWSTGVYFLHEDSEQHQDVHLPLINFQNIPDSTTRNSSYAVFGELAYQFTDQWQGRFGLRYNYEEKELDLQQSIIDPYGIQGIPGTHTVTHKAKENWEAVTPELGLSFTPDANVFYYAKASRGFKAGGYNIFAIQPSFDPEHLWAYELGIKKTLSDHKIRINAALFYYDYTDMQLLTLSPDAPVGTMPIVTNAASATIQGLDLQIWYWPMKNLELTAGATFLDARFDEFNSIDPNNPDENPDHSGEPLPQAPETSLILGVEYQFSFLRHGDLSFSIDYKYQSSIYYNPYHDRAVRQDSYGLINTSLSYYNHKDNWSTELYANNITDELYAQNIIRIDPVVGTARNWAAPRTFGFRLGYRW
ncbi:MAG: TonB-dependent receptor [gamma proteobacterium symbiont of Taylorina sp.]|nr:TonB-dependent receptor [gamma proteobacterium symbiont of Taylorina sp.]